MDFCTYFDSNYSVKGWTCHKTLCEHSPISNLYVLALDNSVLKQAEKRFCDGVIPIALSDVENYYPQLLNAKKTRQLKEYYATLSPILPLYIFDKFDIGKCFYTDADMAFFSEPEEIETVMGEHSLMVCSQGFEPPRLKVRFNVGILGYRNDKNCREFLEWWRDRCLEWCEWRTMPDGRCADQGYLNILHNEPTRFKNTLVCPQPGINLGPWNLWRYYLLQRNGKIVLNNVWTLVCYHFHQFALSDNKYHSTSWKLPKYAIEFLYESYFTEIKKIKENL